MKIKRAAVIFNSDARPETTGVYCRRALSSMLEVEHFSPNENLSLPKNFDLFIHIDDGFRYYLPPDLHPNAFWAIDTHIDFDRSFQKAAQCDFVFAAQKDGAEKLRECGIKTAEWLPLACDSEFHHPHKVGKEHDVCFIGNLFEGPRASLVNLLQSRFANTLVDRRYFEEMAAAYSASRIVFNRSIKDDVNMRVFEAVACGSMLLTNDLSENGQDELFTPGVHLETYRDAEELVDKVEFYLKHEDAREKIAAAGCAEAHAKHTYRHRMERILQKVEAARRAVVPVPEIEAAAEESPLNPPLERGEVVPRKVSACLLSWRRPQNVRVIVEHLKTQPMIDDIVVWNNNPDKPLELNIDNVTVVNAPANLVTYGRFKAIDHVKHDVIYTQDDDCLIGNIEELYEQFQQNPKQLVHGTKADHAFPNGQKVNGSAHMALVGWGSFFTKDSVRVFDRYRQRFGEDELLKRKADRIFTVLLNQPHQAVPAKIIELTGSDGAEALSRRDDHFELTDQAIARALELLHDSDNGNGSAKTNGNGKDRSYFQWTRPELFDRIPLAAKKILDIGCAAGRLGEAIKQRQDAHVVGVELDDDAADEAKRRLDEVVVGDISSSDIEFAENTFDCIICGDILEHVRNPLEVLRRLRTWLTPDGCLVASIPNVRHHSVISSLLDGNWSYEPAGLLDDDHVRFFTRREIEKLFFRSGFGIKELGFVPGDGYQEWVERGRPDEVKIGSLHIGGLPPEVAEEFYAYQYVLTAQPEPKRSDELTSIIIVTHNLLQLTQKCLSSIRFVTDEPYELIVVDNGSTDGTADYLSQCSDVKLIRNPDNRGFPAAVNQGIEAANGKQILLLNNDTVVTTGWLRRMLDALQSRSEIGIVGPLTNYSSGVQQIDVPYQNLECLDGFAWDHGKRNAGRYTPADRLVGFCMLIKREVIDKIGSFDEQFGIGNFEDDDFCRRARNAGFEAVVAEDTFIHHFGSQTFFNSGIDFAGLLEENRQRYEAKWHEAKSDPVPKSDEPQKDDPRQDDPVEPPVSLSVRRGLDGALRLMRGQKKLSLCMIARDNERTIRQALTSIRSYVDEVIVVDTGSTDRTVEICRELGAQVYHFEWCDDFSAARNESLKHATGEWVMWMDTDDEFDAENARKLRQLVLGRHEPNVFGYVIKNLLPTTDEHGHIEMTVVDHVRLFRNRPDLRFEGRIHEQILGAIREAGGEVMFSGISVVESGAIRTPEARKKKTERDLAILHKDLAERPKHPFVHFNLGMTYSDDGQHEEAIPFLKQSIDLAEKTESHLRKAYALLTGSYMELDRYDDAWDACQEGRRLIPEDAELLFREASIHHQLGRLEEAAEAYESILQLKEDEHYASIDPGIHGYKTRHNLALVYEELDDWPKAEQQWRQTIVEQPNYLSGRRGLAAALIKQNKLTAAEQLAGELSRHQSFGYCGTALRGRIAVERRDWERARQYYRSAIDARPSDPGPYQEWCEMLFHHGDINETLAAHEEFTRRFPDDGAGLHNLGASYARLERLEEAEQAFRKSIEMRPDAVGTYYQLASVLVELERNAEAKEVIKRGLEVEPGHFELKRIQTHCDAATMRGGS